MRTVAKIHTLGNETSGDTILPMKVREECMLATCEKQPLSATSKMVHCKHLTIVLALLCVPPIGTLAQKADTAQNPPAPLGKLVDVGGYRVHLYCTGSGSPILRSSSSALDSLSIGGLFSPKSPNLLRCARMIIPESVGAILARKTRVRLGSARYTRQ